MEIFNRNQRPQAEVDRKQFLYYGQAACTLVRKYMYDNASQFQWLIAAKELFLGGAGHHVEELHPRNIELSLQVGSNLFRQCHIAAR